LQLAERINAFTGNKTPIALKPARDWDRSGQRFGDPTKAREQLGFVAQVPHEEGLRRTIEWTRTNRDQILRCMMQHVHYLREVRAYVG
jgi:nucleoside-diphosphate-sugar epimerase